MAQSGLIQWTKRAPSKSLKRLERVKGIEPSSSAWKAVALPLSYTRGTWGSYSPPSRSRIQAGLPAEARRFGGRRLVGEVGLEPTKA